MPKTMRCPDYPYQTPIPLKEFLANNEKRIAKISRSLDKTYKQPGDFTAPAAVMLKHFCLSDKECGKLNNNVSVNIEKLDKKRLEDFENCRDGGRNVFDLLGCYNPKERIITMYSKNIVVCAKRLDRKIKTRLGSPCVATLFYIVFLHELGHALHHSLLCLNSQTTLGESTECEKLAQHFTMESVDVIMWMDELEYLELFAESLRSVVWSFSLSWSRQPLGGRYEGC